MTEVGQNITIGRPLVYAAVYWHHTGRLYGTVVTDDKSFSDITFPQEPGLATLELTRAELMANAILFDASPFAHPTRRFVHHHDKMQALVSEKRFRRDFLEAA